MLYINITQKIPENEESIIADYMNLSELPNFLIEQSVTSLDFNGHLLPNRLLKDISSSFDLFSELAVSITSNKPIEEVHFDDPVMVKIYRNGTSTKEQKYKSVW